MKTCLTSFFLVGWLTCVWAQSPVLHLKYDEADGTQSVLDEAGGQSFQVTNSFNRPERVPGIEGNALRTDGFSTWATRAFNYNFSNAFTLQTWVALESYPSDEEVPYANLTPSAFISQFQGDQGFQMGINTFGVWWFSANINGQKYTCLAPDPFPLYEWAHVAAVIDGAGSTMRLYLNGAQVASVAIPSGGQLQEASVPMYIGKSNTDKINGIFLINALSAAIDETKVYAAVRSAQDLQNDYQSGINAAPVSGSQALEIPSNRFAHDLQRPLYHAMPPANWTNEPHGMVEYNGQYHLFYQRTPNGPFKFQMHWGHMVSADFVHWTHLKDALWPTLEWSSTSGYDMKGIWSGDVVVADGTAHAFYTNVNHTGPYNPGIAHATSSDALLENWEKQGPIIDKQYVNDFRDPYLWREGNTWHMIIGAAVSGSGGLDYYTSSNLSSWTHQSSFSSVSYSQMDPGSAIWEMPVFEYLGNGKHLLIVNPIGGNQAKYGPNYTRGVYWTGTWSGGVFTPDYNQPKRLDLIHGHLSPTVARNVNGQLVGIGIVDERWGSQAQLDAGWCHTYSLPRVYSLLSDGETLGQSPAPELQSLRIQGSHSSESNLAVNGTTTLQSSGHALEIIAQLNPNTTASRYGIHFYVSSDGAEITRLYYDAVNERIILDKSNSSLSLHDEEAVILTGDYDEAAFGKPEKFHVFLDHSVIDVFINDKAAFSNRIYPTLSGSHRVELYSDGATTTFTSVDTWALGLGAEGIAVTGVSLNKTNLVVPLTTTAQLTASVTPSNASNKQVTWASGNEAVATVSSTGVLTPVGKGTTVVTVTTVDGAISAQCAISVVDEPTYQVYDFESGDLTGWTVTGSAFSDENVTTDTAWWGGPFNQQGSYHFWGFLNGGDTPTGSMRTPNFVLGAHGQIDLLIGGGNDFNNLYVALVRSSDDQVLARVTGDNAEGYRLKTIDGQAFTGVTCYIQVVDNSSGGWGHINVDHIRTPVQSGSPVAVTGVTTDRTEVTLQIGDTLSIAETVFPANATNPSVAWASSNTAVATVSSSGLVTAIANGAAMVTVTTQDGHFSAQVAVTVQDQSYLVYDFESGTLAGWTTYGEAFSAGDVTTDTNWGWGGPFGQQGSYHLWGVKSGGDSQTGSMRSQDFVLGGDGIITFLIGGGFDSNSVYLALVRKSDGVELIKATGDDNDSEAYAQKQFNASAYVGTECYLRAVDNATGGWGHINLDNIRIPISQVPVTGISLSASAASVTVGRSVTLVATVTPANATQQGVCWSSSNTAVAMVNKGVVTGVASGTATITAATVDGGVTAQATITVVNQQYLVYDFESGNLNGWTTTGTAFASGDVTTDTNWGWGGPFNQQGSYHLWGVKSGSDSDTGTMQSADFVLDGDGVITFLIGGGFDINTVYLALVRKSDGAELMKATGENNDSEAYSLRQFNAAAFVGTECYLKAVDNATGGWGHINLDNIRIPIASVAVTGVTLTPGSLTLTAGEQAAITATVLPVGATNQKVNWSSSNTAVATVSAGVITAVGAGTATITATTQEGSYSANMSLTVQAQQYLVYDFETGDLTGWTASGSAFSSGDVTTDTDWGWGGPFNQQGSYHLWGVKSGGDSQTGTLQSEDFVLGGDGGITFMIGGGFDHHSVYLALVRKSDGAELMKATGDNNDSEAYATKQFNAGAYIGTECYLRAVDNATGGWGHINLDHLVIPVVNGGGSGARLGSTAEVLAESSSQVQWRIYPNPVADFLRVELGSSNSAEVTIISMDGRRVAGYELRSSDVLDVRGLKPGVYALMISSGAQQSITRIMIR